MIKLAYSTNGITNVDFFKAVQEIKKANYQGVEISFQKGQFDPYGLSDEELDKIRWFFEKNSIEPVGISTGTAFFLSNEYPHEPSIISLDELGRRERISLIKRGIEIAKRLNVPIVTFQTGHLRSEHLAHNVPPRQLLIQGIQELLKNIGDVCLVIEPEPGMFIESLEDGVELVKEINSPSFFLHLDIGHAFCTQKNYVQDIADAVPYTKYIHLADIRDGYNLQFMCFNNFQDVLDMSVSPNFSGVLLYLKDMDVYLFKDNKSCFCFFEDSLSNAQKEKINILSQKLGKNIFVSFVKKEKLDNINVERDIKLEIKAYLESIPGIERDVLKNAEDIIGFLRSSSDTVNGQIIRQAVCNTTQGKVHYHEFPGKGGIDFNAVFKALQDRNYQGYVTVELYNHVDVWEEVIPESYRYLKNCM